eukprot:10492375-Heterocapsa_arctica.AAC.1
MQTNTQELSPTSPAGADWADVVAIKAEPSSADELSNDAAADHRRARRKAAAKASDTAPNRKRWRMIKRQDVALQKRRQAARLALLGKWTDHELHR